MKRLFNTLLLILLGGIITAQSSRDNCSSDRAYLGIYSQSISGEKAALLQYPNPEGSMITEVLIGGAADRAGLQPFDYIYGIDELRTDQKDNLTDLLSNYAPYDQAVVHLIRRGRPLAVDITFGRQSDSMRRKRKDEDQPFLGISSKEATEDEVGVTVKVIDHSTARDMGLRSGDKITAINDHPIVDWSDVTTAINMMEIGDEIAVKYDRAGVALKGSAVIKSRETTRRYEEDHQEVEYAFLGIYSNSISLTKARKLGFENAFGSYVTGVIPNTAAERAKIQPFDYIYGVDEYRTGEGQSLIHILRRYEAGDRAVIHFVRKKENRQVQVTFSSREEAHRRAVDKCDEPFLGVQSSHTYEERTGVNVNVIRNSTAQALGLQDDDLIVRINGYPMIDWDDISTAVNNMTVGNRIEVSWIRNGREEQTSEPILSYCQTKTNQLIYPDSKRETRPDWSPRSGAGSNLRKVEVVVSDVSQVEANEMKRRYKVALSMENELKMRSVSIATRPEQGVFLLSFALPQQGVTIVQIFNNTGRNIYEYDLGHFSGEFSDEVDLSQNGLGTYYLIVKQNGKASSKRIIIRQG